MKNLILLIALTLCAATLMAQDLKEKNVPAEVINAFNMAEPLAKKAEWSKDGNNYEVSYKADGSNKFKVYESSGARIQTEWEPADFTLPLPIMEYIKKNFKKSKVKESSRTTYADGTITYDVELKGADLTFDSKGNFIRSIKNMAYIFIAKPVAIF